MGLLLVLFSGFLGGFLGRLFFGFEGSFQFSQSCEVTGWVLSRRDLYLSLPVIVALSYLLIRYLMYSPMYNRTNEYAFLIAIFTQSP